MVPEIEEALGLAVISTWLLVTICSSSAYFLLPPQLADHSETGARVRALAAQKERTAHSESLLQSIAWRYLPVYALGTLGDWMQGGHIYALYQSYGYSITEIGHIFAFGYSSAALLGTFAAAFGDKYGYRLCVIVYGVCYSIECLSMNVASTPVLLAGRLCGGIAYSLLYVSFESWLVAEGHACELPPEYMGHLFATATTVNALSAVLGGALAHVTLRLGRESAERAHANVYTSPFNVAIVPLLGCSLLAAVLWRERFATGKAGECAGEVLDKTEESERLISPAAKGSDGPAVVNAAWARESSRAEGGAAAKEEQSTLDSLLTSLRRLRRDPVLLHIGLLSSMYEATLYAFVFLWTPALEARARAAATHGGAEPVEIAHGKIFSLLMLCKAVGSRIFAAGLVHHTRTSGPGASQRAFALGALKLTFAISAGCFALPVVSQRYDVTLAGFCAFELMLGFYWPAIAMLRAEFVVEGRSSMMSIFRVMLNVLVILLLELSGVLTETTVFVLSSAILASCWLVTSLLSAHVQGSTPLVGLCAQPKASRSDGDSLENGDDSETRW
jgi:hypothetical protein